MGQVLDAITSLPPAAAYAIIAALVFGEAAVFIGFVLPGETAVLVGGVLASRGRLTIEVLCVLVVVCAIVGDSVGYEVGRQFGTRVLQLRPLRKHADRIHGAQEMLRQRGGFAVFLGRFTAFLRAVMPGLAGVSKMRYPKFLFYNATGGLCWGVGFCLIGYFAGKSYDTIASWIGRGSALVLAGVVVVGLLVWHLRRRHRESAVDRQAKAEQASDAEPPRGTGAQPPRAPEGPQAPQDEPGQAEPTGPRTPS